MNSLHKPFGSHLSSADLREAQRLLCRRFSWIDPRFLDACLKWQRANISTDPSVAWSYFRQHLPRLYTTLQLLNDLPQGALASCVDIGTYSPFAAIARSYLRKHQPHSRWVYSSHTGNAQRYVNDDGPIVIESVAAELNANHLPFQDASFDLILCAEVIEHLTRHPQIFLTECNRILRTDGFILISTPNVTSWKKIYNLTNGNWDYDSPTFSGEWGHRFEYSFWQLQQLLVGSGFSPLKELTRDVYPDDPQGAAQAINLGLLLLAKMITLRPTQAAKLFMRRGSSLFFLYRKTATPAPGASLLSI